MERRSVPEYSLKYGESEVKFTLPEGLETYIIEPNSVSPLENVEEHVYQAAWRLREIVKPGRKIALIADDITRPTPTWQILPPLLNAFNKMGVPDRDIRLIVALGTHRAMREDELRKKYGEALERVEVVQPDFRDPAKLVKMGVMPNGSPIEVNTEIGRSDLAIGVGMITPHHVAGFSGGSKIILPGVSGEKTVGEFHLLSARLRRSFLGSERNQVRDLMDLVAERAKLRGLLDVVVDGRGRVTWVGAGSFQEVYREGVKEARRVYEVKAPGNLDLVIASSYPADIEFWQAHKSIFPADMILRDGGTLILVTPCPEGVAQTHPEVVELTGLTPQEIDERVKTGKTKDPVGAANSMVWSKIRSRIKIVIVSDGIKEEEARSMGFQWSSSLQEAVNQELKRFNKPRIAILKNAPELLPKIEES